jgi:hypothetical protein
MPADAVLVRRIRYPRAVGTGEIKFDPVPSKLTTGKLELNVHPGGKHCLQVRS